MIFHQNIRGISHKTDELIISLLPDTPHVLCLTEHHLQNEEIGTVHLDRYTLGAKFCRKTYKEGGVCIYVINDIQFNAINLDQHNREKDLEICAIKILLPSSSLTVICIYRSPTGIFNKFLNQLESVLNKLHKVSTDLILCGDFSINHLEDNSRKQLLKSLVASFILSSIVKFPT
jgi:exonuclease III